MRAGQLRERITLQRQAEVGRDAFNAPTVDWVTVVESLPASRQDASTGERNRAAQTGATLTAWFRIRASSQVAELNATWRLLHRGKRFDISGVRDLLSDGGALDGYEITATAQADLAPAP